MDTRELPAQKHADQCYCKCPLFFFVFACVVPVPKDREVGLCPPLWNDWKGSQDDNRPVGELYLMLVRVLPQAGKVCQTRTTCLVYDLASI
jgi:hypothetical protein